MEQHINRLEFLIFIAAICMMSAGIVGFYVKLFHGAPPGPVEVLYLPIIAGMGLTVVYRLREAVFGLVSVLPYFLLMLLAVASFKWSQQPTVTLRESFLAMIFTIYLATMCWRYSWKQLIEGMWIALLGMVLLSMVLYVAMPSIGKMADIHVGAMSGVWMEKNAAGQIGVFGACLALARLAISPKTMMSSLLSFLIFSVFLIMSTSKTSLVAYIVGCGGFGWVFLMRRNLPVSMVTLWTSLVGGGLLVNWVKGNTETVLSMLGRSATFTGRSEIWQSLQISLADRPMWGHGYSAYWDEVVYGKTLAYVYDDLQFLPKHSHNSFIEMKLSLGMVGAYLLVGAIAFYLVMSLIRVRNTHGAYFAVPFMAAAIVISMFESVLAGPSTFAGAVLILVAGKMVRPSLPEEAKSGFWKVVNGIRGIAQKTGGGAVRPAAPQWSRAPQAQPASFAKPVYRGPERRKTNLSPSVRAITMRLQGHRPNGLRRS